MNRLFWQNVFLLYEQPIMEYITAIKSKPRYHFLTAKGTYATHTVTKYGYFYVQAKSRKYRGYSNQIVVPSSTKFIVNRAIPDPST